MLTRAWDGPDDRGGRALAAAATTGALLTVVILATSALVRLSTHFEGGQPVTSLSVDMEIVVRLCHRAAAMAAGIAAAVSLVLVVRMPADGRKRTAAGAIVALTVALALIGRYTPGYAHDWITMFHVMAGTLLACAFWWLRMLARAAGPIEVSRSAAVALAMLLGVSGAGAAAAAAAMHGARAFGPFHLWLATGAIGLAWIVAWRARRRAPLAAGIAALALLQGVGGFVQLGLGAAAAPWAGLAHAVVAALLALALVAALDRGRAQATKPTIAA